MIDMKEVLNCIEGSKEIEHMLTTDYVSLCTGNRRDRYNTYIHG